MYYCWLVSAEAPEPLVTVLLVQETVVVVVVEEVALEGYTRTTVCWLMLAMLPVHLSGRERLSRLSR